MVTGSPANEAGVQVGDFLVSVQGQDVFDCDHASVVRTIRGAGKCLNLAVERYITQLILTEGSDFLRRRRVRNSD